MQIFSQDVGSVVFMTKKVQIPHPEASLTLVLSPQYYWVKRVQLPVTRAHQAKRYAPAIFEEHLPDVAHFDYIVTKLPGKNNFVIVAYDADAIFDTLKKQIGDFSKVKRVCFTQFEFAEMEGCLAIEEGASLQRVDDLILYMPASCSDGAHVKHYLENHRLSHHCIIPAVLRQQLIPKRYAYGIVAAMMLLALGFGLEWLYHLKEKREILQSMASLRAQYHLPATSMQRESILGRLQKVAREQKQIRKLLQSVAAMPLDGKGIVQELHLNKDGSLDLEIGTEDPSLQQRMVRYLDRYATIVRVSYENGHFKVTLR